MRFVYVLLISLHPPSFRRRFAQEMLLIFDEAANSWGAGALVASIAALHGCGSVFIQQSRANRVAGNEPSACTLPPPSFTQ